MWRAALVFLLVLLVVVGALMTLKRRMPGPLPKNFKPRPWKDDKENDEW